ncbi:MAG: Gfo/Idh/MocA family oxidoreductase [Oscillospiraceae bacterium]|jgi:predicted dehydrogenase/sugar phosphate isomerase/epimerase|nr:Gfo/Idh/MocA family oxidoreductase [Oscillospiraceae bacterium]
MAKFLFSAFADEAAKDLESQIAACKANGVGSIELRGVNGRNISAYTPEEAKELKQQLDAAGITVSSIGSPYGKIFIGQDFEPHFAEFKNTVAVADILEAPYIRLFSFYFGEGDDYEALKGEVFRRVEAMAQYAKQKGVLCCHENEKGIFGDQTRRCLELHEALGDQLGCAFDFANFMECGVDPLEAYQLLKPYITYFHIKDYSHSSGAVVPAGLGDGHIAEILADFDLYKHDRVTLSLEPHLKIFKGLENLEIDNGTVERLQKKELFKTSEEAFAAAAAQMHAVAAQAQPVTLGIIGYGNMGSSHMRMHITGEHTRTRVTAVADTNPERLEKAQQDLPGVAVFADAQSLIESGLCTAVVIATPHYDHPPIAIAALAAGLHVMTEKPAGVYTRQVREMNEAAAKSDKIFAIMYNQRSVPLHQKLRELVQGGQYGELKRVVWIICDWYRTQAYYNSGGWRATWSGEGGGVLINQCPHNLDLWQWICGMPSKVRASCHDGKWHNIEVEDDVTIYAEYPNGATGVFITTTGEPAGTDRLEITLDKAKIVSENNKLVIYELEGSTKEHIFTATQGFGALKSTAVELEIPRLNASQHAVVLNAFAEATLTGDRSKLYARGEEGVNGLSISNAAHLSSWLGQDVALPIDEDLYYAELQKKIATSQAKTGVVDTVAADMAESFK